MIYFDYNSTAPYSPSVREYLEQSLLRDWQNPSAVYPQARIMDQQIKKCRQTIADFLNCSPKNLFFTSGGTEAINTVLSLDTLKLNGVSTIISSPLEHHATLKKLEYLKGKQNGNNKIQIYWVGNNEQGEINLSELEKLCKKYPHSLVSLLSANNETGVITNIKAVSQIAKKHNCLIHVDGVQSLGKIPVDLADLDLDFASFSGHKVGAMKGVGLFYTRKPFAPLMHGGEQERSLRPGTYNFPAIYSLKLALRDVDFQKWEKIKSLRNYLEKSLLSECGYITQKEILAFSRITKKYKHISHSQIPAFEGITSQIPTQDRNDNLRENRNLREKGKTKSEKRINPSLFKINGQKAHRLTNTSSIYCKGISNQEVLLYLSRKGICASAGSACNAGSPEPSHVITALKTGFNLNPDGQRSKSESFYMITTLGIDGELSARDYARSCIRVSLSPSNTKEEVNFLIHSLKELSYKQTNRTIPIELNL